MGQPKDDSERLFVLAGALADSVAAVSDAELLSEAKNQGRDPEKTRGRVQALLTSAVRSIKRTRLNEAEVAYSRSVREIQAARVALPSTALERRTLFERALRVRPDLQAATLQHRNLEELSDEDIESGLRQLHFLGVLDDLKEK
jgi:hypothetical protein